MASDSFRSSERRRVGLIYDERMCNHFNPKDEEVYKDSVPKKVFHPERPDRILKIWNKLHSSGIAQRCTVMDGKEAADEHIELVHTKKHVDFIRNISSQDEGFRKKMAKKYNSVYFNEGSSEAAYLSAGSVIKVAEKVAEGELDSAFAIVRPPGHHAEANKPMGFCLYNNIAIATHYLLDKRPDLGIGKIFNC